jgi:hypothetical protein
VYVGLSAFTNSYLLTLTTRSRSRNIELKTSEYAHSANRPNKRYVVRTGDTPDGAVRPFPVGSGSGRGTNFSLSYIEAVLRASSRVQPCSYVLTPDIYALCHISKHKHRGRTAMIMIMIVPRL